MRHVSINVRHGGHRFEPLACYVRLLVMMKTMKYLNQCLLLMALATYYRQYCQPGILAYYWHFDEPITILMPAAAARGSWQ